jgi:hypothetical protein
MDIIIYAVIFWSGTLVGYLGRVYLEKRFKDYSGTIVVDTDKFAEKTVYSLVLDDYPEKLEFKKEVVFKIDSSARSSDRK